MPPRSIKAVFAVLGPTASGKTGLALDIAQQIGAEIISCDSMQIYREMDIGSAKATPEEQELIPHHFIDEKDIHDPYTAKEFAQLAAERIEDIHSRGKHVLVVGGTGLYAKMLFYGSGDWPSDVQIAAEVRELYENEGKQALCAALLSHGVDLSRFDDNPRHLMRALEVVRICGHLPKQSFEQEAVYPGQQYVLIPEVSLTWELIAKRCAEMLDEGWIEEGKKLIAKGLLDTPMAKQAIGYKEIDAYLKGEMNRAELEEKITIATRQYAKRQRTWFRGQHSGAKICEFTSREEFASVKKEILTEIQSFLEA